MTHHSPILGGHDLDQTRAKRIETCGFNAMEIMLLEFIRCFCLNHAAPQTQSWMLPFDRASQLFGLHQGGAIAKSVSDLVEAVRQERETDFNFVDPRCEKCSQHVFETEIALIEFMRAVLNRDGEAEWVFAQKVLEGGACARTLQAGHMLGQEIMSVQETHSISTAPEEETTPADRFDIH